MLDDSRFVGYNLVTSIVDKITERTNSTYMGDKIVNNTDITPLLSKCLWIPYDTSSGNLKVLHLYNDSSVSGKVYLFRDDYIDCIGETVISIFERPGVLPTSSFIHNFVLDGDNQRDLNFIRLNYYENEKDVLEIYYQYNESGSKTILHCTSILGDLILKLPICASDKVLQSEFNDLLNDYINFVIVQKNTSYDYRMREGFL